MILESCIPLFLIFFFRWAGGGGGSFNHSHRIFLLLRTFNTEALYIEVWFSAGNSKLLEAEDEIRITLLIS